MPVRPPAQRGFTLLEILVVVFIIGVIVAFTVLSTGNPDADNLDNEARRLHSVLELAAEEAVLYGTEIGVDLARTQYRFLRLDADGWTPMTDRSSPLRPHELKPRIELRLLQTEDEQAAGFRENAKAAAEDESRPRPELLFLSSGEMLPFELQVRADTVDRSYILSGELTGELDIDTEESL
jgi:general secretion pathway protein H